MWELVKDFLLVSMGMGIGVVLMLLFGKLNAAFSVRLKQVFQST